VGCISSLGIADEVTNLMVSQSFVYGDIESRADEGGTVLAELTEQSNAKKEELDEKEMEWLELAELVEQLESEEELSYVHQASSP